MEFTSRGNNQAATPQAAHHPAPGRLKRNGLVAKTIRIEIFIVIVGCALLLAAVSLYLALSGGLNNESKLVDNTKYQAVFLNGGFDFTIATGQPIAYFGHVKDINSKYTVLQDVYYLTAAQQPAQNGSTQTVTQPQLVKLGCQLLHSPYDQMVINHDQIAYWENLKDNGKVVEAIKQYIKQYPTGPDCSATATTKSATTTP